MQTMLLFLMLCMGQFSVSVEPSRPVFEVVLEKTEKPKAAAEPEMIFLTAKWCLGPCNQVKEDVKAGKFKGVKVVECDIETGKPPIQVDSVPAFWWKSPDGREWRYPKANTPLDKAGYVGAEAMMAMWRETQKPAMKATSELDQLTPEQRAIYDYWRGRGYSHEQIRRYAIRNNLWRP